MRHVPMDTSLVVGFQLGHTSDGVLRIQITLEKSIKGAAEVVDIRKTSRQEG